MSKGKTSIRNSLIFLITAAVAVIMVWWAGFKLSGSLEQTRTTLQKELNALPQFDRNAERTRLTEEHHISTRTLNEKYPPVDKLERIITEQLRLAIEQEFNPEAIRWQEEKVRKENSLYPGKQLDIKYNSDSGNIESISGKYEGGNSGMIFINGKAIKAKSILPEYRNQIKVSPSQTETALKKFRQSLQTRREGFSQNKRAELEAEIFSAKGYLKTSNGRWLTPLQFIDEELQIREQRHNADIDNKIAGLRQKYKAWGIFSFNLQNSTQK